MSQESPGKVLGEEKVKGRFDVQQRENTVLESDGKSG